MRYLADMGVSLGVVSWLRSVGNDAVHLCELGEVRATDFEIFAKGQREDRVILTFDLDFGEILALSGGKIVSVILFRLNNTTTPFVIRRLTLVLPEVAEVLEKGAVVVVEDHRYRVRRLPLGA